MAAVVSLVSSDCLLVVFHEKEPLSLLKFDY